MTVREYLNITSAPDLYIHCIENIKEKNVNKSIILFTISPILGQFNRDISPYQNRIIK